MNLYILDLTHLGSVFYKHLRICFYVICFMGVLSSLIYFTTQPVSSSVLQEHNASTLCNALPRPEFASKLDIEQVFAEFSFERPIGLYQAPGDHESWYLVEQGGLIKVFKENDDQTSMTAHL